MQLSLYANTVAVSFSFIRANSKLTFALMFLRLILLVSGKKHVDFVFIQQRNTKVNNAPTRKPTETSPSITIFKTN